MKIITYPDDIETAWAQQYAELVRPFSSFLPSKKTLIVEIGCGKGQLSIPLAKQTANRRFIAVDSYRRPYSRRDYRELVSELDRERLKQRVRVVVSDQSYWLSRQSSGKFDAVISSEFLPEVDSAGVKKFFSECWRVTRPGGVTVHSFLSAVARNLGQRLLIEADSNPRWTKDPPKEWFSPRPELVAAELRRAGFKRLRAIRMQSRLVFKGEAARTLLKEWGVRDTFWKKHQQYLRLKGLEVPDWVVIAGVRPFVEVP